MKSQLPVVALRQVEQLDTVVVPDGDVPWGVLLAVLRTHVDVRVHQQQLKKDENVLNSRFMVTVTRKGGVTLDRHFKTRWKGDSICLSSSNIRDSRALSVWLCCANSAAHSKSDF